MKLCYAILVLLLLGSSIGSAQAQVFDPAKVGPPLSNEAAELYLPNGLAPGAAVVVFHGDGIGPHDRWWARRLTEWGFAALLINSFGPRGYIEVCNRGHLVPPDAQARDAFDGAAYLRAAPTVRAQRVGVVGFSHGGWAVLKAVPAGMIPHPNEPPFAAAVAYYPVCDPPTVPLETDILILSAKPMKGRQRRVAHAGGTRFRRMATHCG
jgi:dienelactone hydrolase